MAFEYLDFLYDILTVNNELESNIPMKIFFEEYKEKKNTHSISVLDELDTKKKEDVFYIDLTRQEITDLTILMKFKNLQYLVLDDCPIENLEGIEQFNKLKFLGVEKSDNNKSYKLDVLPTGITYLTSLLELHLANNNLSLIDIKGLNQLQRLNIQDNPTQRIDLSSANNLQYISIDSNQLNSIYTEHYISMKNLDIHNNNTHNIFIGKLINVQKLRLINNLSRVIDISNLTSLQELYIESGSLFNIKFGTLLNLKKLDVFESKIISIDLSGLLNLEELHLGSNNLTNINLNNLFNLKKLSLFLYGTSSIDNLDISHLTKLDILRVSGKSNINIDFNHLINLKDLYISNCGLNNINLNDLVSLHDLDLRDNNLDDINLNGLVNLKNLDISDNCFENIPLHIADLENTLQTFNISKNPLSKMPEGFASWGLSKQMRFLNQQRGYGYFYAHWDMPEDVAILFSSYLNRFKSIVREKTGKEIHFEIQTEANGLRLVTKAGKDFSLEDINGMLFYYLATLINQSSLQSQKLEDEIRNLKFRLERLEFENKELEMKISLFRKENIDLRGEKDDLQGKLIVVHEKSLDFIMKIQQPQNKHESVTFSIPQFTQILETLKPTSPMIDISPEFKNIGNPQVTNTNTNTNTNSLSNSQEFSIEAFRKEITPFISRLNLIKEDLEESEKTDEIKPLLEEIVKLLKSAESVAKEEDKEKIKSASFWTRLGDFYQKTKTEVGSLIKYLTPDTIKKVQESAKMLGKLTGYEFEGSE